MTEQPPGLLPPASTGIDASYVHKPPNHRRSPLLSSRPSTTEQRAPHGVGVKALAAAPRSGSAQALTPSPHRRARLPRRGQEEGPANTLDRPRPFRDDLRKRGLPSMPRVRAWGNRREFSAPARRMAGRMPADLPLCRASGMQRKRSATPSPYATGRVEHVAVLRKTSRSWSCGPLLAGADREYGWKSRGRSWSTDSSDRHLGGWLRAERWTRQQRDASERDAAALKAMRSIS